MVIIPRSVDILSLIRECGIKVRKLLAQTSHVVILQQAFFGPQMVDKLFPSEM